ncbi:hypothetical protein U1Q18_038169 [Sarracenia purpurea var. burkii]
MTWVSSTDNADPQGGCSRFQLLELLTSCGLIIDDDDLMMAVVMQDYGIKGIGGNGGWCGAMGVDELWFGAVKGELILV